MMSWKSIGTLVGGIGALVFLNSCSSLQSLNNYVEDDLYYSDPSRYNINPNTIGLNSDVAVPDSAMVYFDETYALTQRPNYQRYFELEGDEPIDYNYDSTDIYEQPYDPCPNSWRGNPGWNGALVVGTGVGMGTWNGMQNQGYYTQSYYPYSNRAYTRNPTRTNYPVGTTDLNSGGNQNSVPPIVYRPPSRPTRPKYTPNPNPGYDSNADRSYRTRSSSGEGYTSPGYHNSTRGGATNYGGGNSQSVPRPTIQGVRRR